MMNIAIVVITYNRIKSLQRLIKSIEDGFFDGNNVDLIISIDKSKTDEIERWANDYQWTHGNYRVITHKQNLGLRAHVLECGNIVNDYDAIIMFEDDVSVSPNFYRYAKQCVEFYHNDDRIAGISLYNFVKDYQSCLPFEPVKSEYDVFFMNVAQSWGQVWMRKQWQAFYEWYCKDPSEIEYAPHLTNIWRWAKSSWLKYHMKYCLEKNKYFVYPYYSLSTNNSEAGTHAGRASTLSQGKMLALPQKVFKLVNLDDAIVKYDAFFEPKFLSKALDVPEEELCVDFHNEKRNRLKKHFWLTTSVQPYKVIRSFALQLKPFELNILQNREGDQLFLYDTSISATPPTIDKLALYHYLYTDGVEMSINVMGRCNVIKYMLGRSLKNKIKRLKKKLSLK